MKDDNGTQSSSSDQMTLSKIDSYYLAKLLLLHSDSDIEQYKYSAAGAIFTEKVHFVSGTGQFRV